MTKTPAAGQRFNIMIVGQDGRLGYEAVLFAASLRARSPGFAGRLIVAEPQPGPLWSRDPRMTPEVRAELERHGAEIRPFDSAVFGEAYLHGNKIEGLSVLPEGEPFVFFDTDTLILDEISAVPFDFDRPSASMRREGTWPQEEVYWPGHSGVWGALYDRFGLDLSTSLDLSQPDEYWQRYLYFSAGWFFGADPVAFGARFLDWARSIRDDTPEALAAQSLDPWLDQVALPLVIHSFGGGRPGPDLAGLDGDVTCHWRVLSLLYARESDKAVEVLEEVTAPNRIKRLLKEHEPFLRLVYQGRGRKARALFDRDDLPRQERKIRGMLRKNGYWMR